MSLILRDAIYEFVVRMEDILLQLDEAIRAADADAQQSAYEAIVGQIENLKSAAGYGGDEPDPLA
jgi:hypothetical protein